LRLAIFGGTFDPVHNGHLTIARMAADHFCLDRVLFVPAEHPPHKSGVTEAPFNDRVHMVELACADEPRFAVSRIEEGTKRSYSIDTIDKVKAKLAPADKLFFIIGADAFAEIRTWHRWQDVARAVCFLVVSRPGHTYETPAEVSVQRLDTVDLPVSSSEIRRALAAGLRPRDIAERVLEYISKHRLYLA